MFFNDSFVSVVFRECSSLPSPANFGSPRPKDPSYRPLRFNKEYNGTHDTCDTKYIIIPSVLLALVMHPRLNRYPPSDIAWAMALYLEALAAIPQLFMFQSEKKV